MRKRRKQRSPNVGPMSLGDLLYASDPINEEDARFLAYHWVRRHLFGMITAKLNGTGHWENRAWQPPFFALREELLKEWARVHRFYRRRQPRFLQALMGVRSEALFYWSWLRLQLECYDPEDSAAFPPALQLIPIDEPIPHVFRRRTDRGWTPGLPQIRADFVLAYWEGKRGSWPPAYFDVKSSERAFQVCKPKLRVQAHGAWLQECYFYVAYPKKPDPKHIDDWEMGQVCMACGSLCQVYRDTDRPVLFMSCPACGHPIPDRLGLEGTPFEKDTLGPVEHIYEYYGGEPAVGDHFAA